LMLKLVFLAVLAVVLVDGSTFELDIAPLILSVATGHTGGASSGGLSMGSTPTSLYNAIYNVSSGEDPTKLYINPGNSALSYLYLKLTPNPPSGSRMPQSGTPFTQVQLDLVQAWIDSGASFNGSFGTSVSSSSGVASSSSVIGPVTPGTDLHFYLWAITCGGSSALPVFNFSLNNGQCLPLSQVESPFKSQFPPSVFQSSISLTCDLQGGNYSAYFYSDPTCTTLNSTVTGQYGTTCQTLTFPGSSIQPLLQVVCNGGGSSSTGPNGASALAPQAILIAFLLALAVKFSN